MAAQNFPIEPGNDATGLYGDQDETKVLRMSLHAQAASAPSESCLHARTLIERCSEKCVARGTRTFAPEHRLPSAVDACTVALLH
jgi:hypothetical protein